MIPTTEYGEKLKMLVEKHAKQPSELAFYQICQMAYQQQRSMYMFNQIAITLWTPAKYFCQSTTPPLVILNISILMTSYFLQTYFILKLADISPSFAMLIPFLFFAYLMFSFWQALICIGKQVAPILQELIQELVFDFLQSCIDQRALVLQEHAQLKTVVEEKCDMHHLWLEEKQSDYLDDHARVAEIHYRLADNRSERMSKQTFFSTIKQESGKPQWLGETMDALIAKYRKQLLSSSFYLKDPFLNAWCSNIIAYYKRVNLPLYQLEAESTAAQSEHSMLMKH